MSNERAEFAEFFRTGWEPCLRAVLAVVGSPQQAALAAEGHRLLDAGRPAAAARVLREGLALWRGPALAEVADAGFAQAERNRLEELRVAALEDRLAADLDLGGHAAAVAELEKLASLYPFHERLHGLWMLALYRSGAAGRGVAGVCGSAPRAGR